VCGEGRGAEGMDLGVRCPIPAENLLISKWYAMFRIKNENKMGFHKRTSR